MKPRKGFRSFLCNCHWCVRRATRVLHFAGQRFELCAVHVQTARAIIALDRPGSTRYLQSWKGNR